jgi:single-strand DNA-binding protein
MSANNQVVLIGRAGNNVAEDVRKLQSGSMVAEVRLAVNRPGKDPSGNSITDWVSCQFWNKNAERLSEFVKKGDLLSVSGSIRVDNWEQEGQRRQKYFIHGENFQMLESRSARQERQQSESGGGYGGGSSYDGGGSGGGGYNNASQGASSQGGSSSSYNDEFALDDDELPPF